MHRKMELVKSVRCQNIPTAASFKIQSHLKQYSYLLWNQQASPQTITFDHAICLLTNAQHVLGTAKLGHFFRAKLYRIDDQQVSKTSFNRSARQCHAQNRHRGPLLFEKTARTPQQYTHEKRRNSYPKWRPCLFQKRWETDFVLQ